MSFPSLTLQNKQRTSVDMWCDTVNMIVYADALNEAGFSTLEDLVNLDGAFFRLPLVDHRLIKIVESWHAAGFLRFRKKLSEIQQHKKNGFFVTTPGSAEENYCKTDAVIAKEKEIIQPQVDALLSCMTENPQWETRLKWKEDLEAGKSLSQLSNVEVDEKGLIINIDPTCNCLEGE
tara:strand:- start:791 stop:1321 length:531 start_codon:yes stop_codon:yes gene_type:complete